MQMSKENKTIKGYRAGSRAWYNFCEWLAYALTYRKVPKGVLYEKHVPYGDEKMQFYNAFCREDLLQTEKPLFLYIHGGGFISGVTDMRNTYVQNFAQEGFYAASVSYAYAPEKVHPAQLQELLTAIDTIFDRAEEKKIDKKRLLLSAESAGTYYAFMLCAFASDPSLIERMGLSFRHKEDFSVTAFISHSGCFDLQKMLDPACPQSRYPDIKMMTCSYLGRPYQEARAFLETPEGQRAYPHIDGGFPPTFFCTGAADPLRYESYDAMQAYEKYNVPFDRFEGTGAYKNHAWTIATTFRQGKECLARSLDFVRPYFFEQNKDKASL